MSGSRQPWRRTRTAYALAAGGVAALTIGLIPPAAAEPPTPRDIAAGDGTELLRTEQPIAPGTELSTFQRLESDKWLNAQAVSLDLTEDIQIDYLATEDVADAATIAELAEAHDPGPGRTTVAAINADFFDINATNAPLAPGISDGELVHSGTAGRSQVVGFAEDGAGRVMDLFFEGKATLPDGVQELATYNAAAVPMDGIGLYTPQWGEADRGLPVLGASEVTEVLVEDGEVTGVSEDAGKDRVPDGGTVLLGRDGGADALATLDVGDPVEVEFAPVVSGGGDVPRTAVGGNGVLVIDGEPQDWEGLPNNATAPRTAVGFSKDGSEMHILTVDGRQAHSGGVTLTELAIMMADLGAHSALNLDGGGSTTLVARDPGGDELNVINSPSDGVERVVPNGLVVTAPEGNGGRPAGFSVRPTADPSLAPTGEPIGDGNPDWVFSGLTRDLTATAYDHTYGPTDARPRWRSTHPPTGTVSRDGVFTAGRPGTVEVQARDGSAFGSVDIRVLDELVGLEPTRQRVGLADSADSARFGLLGRDAAGYTAPVDPADIDLDYDSSLFNVAEDPTGGGFTLTAVSDEFSSGVITATVGEATTTIAASVGFEDHVVADFEEANDWEFSHARADGALFSEPDGQEGAALGMEFDFSLSTGTRAAYATPVGGDIRVTGQPQSFSLWINGDGEGAWPSLHLKDASGNDQVLRADHLDHEGWEQITFEVPDGVTYPVSVHRFYIAETRPDIHYTSQIAIDELTAHTPPDAELPDRGLTADPLISTAASAEGRDWQFAVVSDAQFVARDPESDIVEAARRTLRDARASEPDFVMINGDWVDEGGPADLAFAKEMIEEELGDTPWYYVPGNHEVMGGSIGEWEEVFGDRQLTFDHEGTRFITLDTSSLSISGGGYGQWQELSAQLNDAASDHAISSVVVVAHVPPRDTMPHPASQLTDRMDAWLLERWLADFRTETGKGVAFLGSHVGIFDSYHMKGVPYLINGNSGKGPAAQPDEGGFSGWSTVGVDHVSRGEQKQAQRQPHLAGPDWVSVQTRPHVDGLRLDAPATLKRGESAEAAAFVTQDLDRTAEPVEVPAAYPVSTDWSGSRNLHIGDPGKARGNQVAAFDPETGELTALRAGRVTLTVTVNDESKSTDITIRR